MERCMELKMNSITLKEINIWDNGNKIYSKVR